MAKRTKAKTVKEPEEDFTFPEYPDPPEYPDFPDFPDDAAAEVVAPVPIPEEPAEPHVPMRVRFPEAGVSYLGGVSDGWEYRSIFGGSKLETTYDMVRGFLQEEGYGDVPLPATAADLRLFRKPRHPQLQLFPERGYIHNPVKILFPEDAKQRNTLILCVYNEQVEDHLLRFHGVK